MSTTYRPNERTTGLMSKVAMGDRSAFQQLYEETSHVLYGVILKIVRQPSEAEDVLQEVFVKVWRSASTYMVQSEDPLPWLIRVARNAAIDGLRRQAVHKEHLVAPHDSSDGGEDPIARMPHHDPGPLEMLSAAGDKAKITHCMGSLQGTQRVSIALAYYQGLSHQEIAEQLREPLGTIKSWIRRGLLALRGCLER